MHRPTSKTEIDHELHQIKHQQEAPDRHRRRHRDGRWCWRPHSAGGKTKAAAGEGDGHGHGTHTEAKGHGDGEHHGKADGKGHDDDKGHADGEHHEKSESKGTNGGSLFKEGDFGLEALLAEDGGEPRLRVWMFDKDKPLPQSAATVAATITRPTGEKQTLSFIQEKDGWVSRESVAEPHAFDIEIIAQKGNEPFMFVMSKEEGKVELTDAQIKAAAIGVDSASAASIKSALLLPGEIRLNEDRHLARGSTPCWRGGKR